MGNLHEKSFDQRFANVDVIILRIEVCASFGQVESVHNSAQLSPDIVGLFERSSIDEILVAPP